MAPTSPRGRIQPAISYPAARSTDPNFPFAFSPSSNLAILSPNLYSADSDSDPGPAFGNNNHITHVLSMDFPRHHDITLVPTIIVTPDDGDDDGDEGSGLNLDPVVTVLGGETADILPGTLASLPHTSGYLKASPETTLLMLGSPSSSGNDTFLATQGSRTLSSRPSSISSWTSSPRVSQNDTTDPSHDVAQSDLALLVSDDENPFLLRPEDLTGLMNSRDPRQLQAYGGLDAIAEALRTNYTTGLTNQGDLPSSHLDCTHDVRRAIFGTNRLPDKKAKTIWQYTVEAVTDPTAAFLLIVDLVILILGVSQWASRPGGPADQGDMEWLDVFPAIVAVLIVILANIFLAYRTDVKFSCLSKKKEDRLVQVIRSGLPTSISVHDLMAGDLLVLKQGDIVPADGILISGCHIQCDQSCITGESWLVDKTGATKMLHPEDCPLDTVPCDPFIISGSKILGAGLGSCLVTCIGVHSIYGRIRLAITERTEETPLQQRLGAITKKITLIASTVACLLLVILLVKSASAWPGQIQGWQKTLDIFRLAITVIFVAVPEGLPMAVIVTLKLAAGGMNRDKLFVRKLASCETMGNATTICCDKTGTLTMNEMNVTAGIIGVTGRFVEGDVGYSGAPYHPNLPEARGSNKSGHVNDGGTTQQHQSQVFQEICPQLRDLLAKSVAINSTAFEGYLDGLFTYLGSSTETALLRFAQKRAGLKFLQQERERADIVEVFPFDSTKKCMATVTKLSETSYRMYVKGAPEILLDKSDRTIADLGQLQDTVMTAEKHEFLKHVITEYASSSLRTLGLAYRDFSTWPPLGLELNEEPNGDGLFQHAFRHLIFLGIFGFQDPLRPGVKQAVMRCKRAGVRVRMVTGDNVETAKAIATKCGILVRGDQEKGVMEGPQFRALSADEMKTILPNLRVLARSSPDDKKLLVTKLKELGETVAVTGDGTNDGPALRAADVGFAMGILGTEVAKEASSIVLLDDNFASIVKAIEWGRTVIDAIRRFLQFQLTANLTAVTLTVVSSITSSSQKPILTTVQLLWLNLIMDSLAAIALATDRPDPSVLDRLPEKRTAPLLSWATRKMIAGQAIYQLIVGLYLSLHAGQASVQSPPNSHRPQGGSSTTLFFNIYIWMQFFNLVNCRRIDNKINIFKGVMRNKYFLGTGVCIVLVQVSFISFGGHRLGVKPLAMSEWALSLALGFVSIPLGVVIRCIPDEPLERIGAWLVNRSNRAIVGALPDISTQAVRSTDSLPSWNAQAEPGLSEHTWGNPGWLQRATHWIGSLRHVIVEPGYLNTNPDSILSERSALLGPQQHACPDRRDPASKLDSSKNWIPP